MGRTRSFNIALTLRILSVRKIKFYRQEIKFVVSFRSLWTFVEEVKKTPEKYVEEKILESQVTEDHLSDTGSWGTDFEDETNEESALQESQKAVQSNLGLRSSQKLSQNNANSKQQEEISRQEEEGTYANCGSLPRDESTYANCDETKTISPKNTSRLHSLQTEKSLAEQLKEQLKLRNTKKPMAGPKPESLQSRKVEVSPLGRTQPQKSFLHNVSMAKPNTPSQTQSQYR